MPAPLAEKRWREENGVIHLNVTSEGLTNARWVGYFEKRNQFGRMGKAIVRDIPFEVTNNVTYNVVLLRGNDRNLDTIQEDARSRGLTKADPHVICLILKSFSNEELHEMGIWRLLATKDLYRHPTEGESWSYLFGVGWGRQGCRVIEGVVYADYDVDKRWQSDNAFVYLV